MMCQRIGEPPISTIGFGVRSVSSASLVPSPPAKITVFTRPRSPCESCGARGSRGASGAGTTRASRRRLGAGARAGEDSGRRRAGVRVDRRDRRQRRPCVVHAASYSLLTRRRASTSGSAPYGYANVRTSAPVSCSRNSRDSQTSRRSCSPLASGTGRCENPCEPISMPADTSWPISSSETSAETRPPGRSVDQSFRPPTCPATQKTVALTP